MKHGIEASKKIRPNLEYRVGIAALPILVLIGIVAAIAFGELELTFILSICFVPLCLGLLIAGTLPKITVSESGIVQKGLFGQRVYKWQDAELMYSNLFGGIQLRFSRIIKNNENVEQPVDFPLSTYIENWDNSHILDTIVRSASHVEFPVEKYRSFKSWPFWAWPVTLFVILLFTLFLSLPLIEYSKEASFPQYSAIVIVSYIFSHVSAGSMLLFYMNWLRFQNQMGVVIRHAVAIVFSPIATLLLIGLLMYLIDQAISPFNNEFVNRFSGVIAVLIAGYLLSILKNLFVFGRVSRNVSSHFDEDL